MSKYKAVITGEPGRGFSVEGDRLAVLAEISPGNWTTSLRRLNTVDAAVMLASLIVALEEHFHPDIVKIAEEVKDRLVPSEGSIRRAE